MYRKHYGAAGLTVVRVDAHSLSLPLPLSLTTVPGGVRAQLRLSLSCSAQQSCALLHPVTLSVTPRFSCVYSVHIQSSSQFTHRVVAGKSKFRPSPFPFNRRVLFPRTRSRPARTPRNGEEVDQRGVREKESFLIIIITSYRT